MWNKVSFLMFCVLCAGVCLAQTTPPAYMVQTLAGSAPMGDGGPANSAVLRFPNALTFDSLGNLYIADQGNSSVRTVNSTSGIISTVAGTGITGFSGDGGPANLAQLGGTISGLAFDAAGNLYISDSANHRVREVTKDGNINTVLPEGNLPGPLSASFWPNGLAFDKKGNLYIADDHNSQVYVMTPDGIVTVYAGNGTAGDNGDGGPASAAALVEPFGIFVDATGAVYISDIAASRVRMVTPDGTIHAFAGTGQAGLSGDGGPAVQAKLGQPMHLAGDKAGNLYVTDHSVANRNIRMIAPDGSITTFAGALNPNGMMSGDGGPASMAMIQQASGIAVSPTGALYFADSNSSVRVVSNGIVSTAAGYRHFAGDSVPATQSLLSSPHGLAIDVIGNVYVADSNNFRLRQIDVTGMMWTVAGTGQCGLTGDWGTAVSAAMTRPLAVATDTAQNIYLGFDGYVRLITPGGIIRTIAGGGTVLDSGISASSASLGKVNGIAVDASGNIYLSDTDHHVIRKITPDGVIRTVAGTGTAGQSGDGSAAISAQLNSPTGLAFDSAGNLYIADTNNSRIREIRTDGTIVTFAGTGKVGESGDGGPALIAQLANPTGIVVDKAGTVYISDSVSGMVRTVTSDGVIHSIAGAGADPSYAGFSGDGGLALSAQFNGIGGLAVDGSGRVYAVDQQNERIRMLTPMTH